MPNENVVEEEVVVETPEVDPYEEEARRDGWVPEEEYNGPHWVDAKTFVERGHQINAILNAKNARLMKQLEDQKKEVENLRLTTEEFKKFIKEQTKQKLEIYESEIAVLKAEKKRAASDGELDRIIEIDDKIDELREQKAAAKVEENRSTTATTATTKVEPAPEVKEWVSANSWYTQDSSMQAAANKLAEEINMFQPHLKGKDFFDALDSALEKKFTLTALGRENKKVKPRNPVESGGGGPTSFQGKKKGYDQLPADAKKECDRFVKEGLFKNREEYVEMYEWE